MKRSRFITCALLLVAVALGCVAAQPDRECSTCSADRGLRRHCVFHESGKKLITYVQSMTCVGSDGNADRHIELRNMLNLGK